MAKKKSEPEIPAAKKQKIFISPRGSAKYPWLRKPDTRFDAEGKFHVTLILDPATVECEEFTKMVSEWASKKNASNVPFKEVDGAIHVKFSTAYPPSVFDAKRNIIPETVQIGNGSIVKVAYQPNYYSGFGGGINLYMKAVQVLEYVPYTGPDAESLGFDEEEGFSPETDIPEFTGDGPPPDAESSEDNLPF